MTLIRTVEPDVEPVSLSEAKAFLRLSGTSEDELLAGLIRAAREDVERTTGLALIEQDWRLVVDDVPATGTLVLVRTPVREILGVTVFGAEGEASVVSPSHYAADLVSRPARIAFLQAPAPTTCVNGIEVDFRAGFGQAGHDVPDLLRRAITVLVAHWYEFRARYGPQDQPVSYPPVYDRLIAPFRDVRL
jgi:uncharacterized phiE125 gp8 family phage protein